MRYNAANVPFASRGVATGGPRGVPEQRAFPQPQLPDSLVQDLRRTNPWWEGRPGPVLPATRRHLVGAISRRLELGLAPIVMVRGPRQVGKTTAQAQLLQDLLAGDVEPHRVLHVQCDELPGLGQVEEPVLRVVDWYEQAVLGRTLNEAAHEGRPVCIFLDEVQNLEAWGPQLKFLVDSSTVRVVVTGSSALRLELGRDSLAGRITTLDAGVLTLTEVGRFHGLDLGEPHLPGNGLQVLAEPEFWRGLGERGRACAESRNTAFACFSERGGYPLAHRLAEVAWADIADQLNETVVRRVIQHDALRGDASRRRDPQLLEEVFRLACRYAGQIPGSDLLAREAGRALSSDVGPQRARNHLDCLAGTLLLRLIEPLEIRLKKKRGGVKICLCDHALRASWLQEIVPLDPPGLEREPHLTTLAGHIAESVVGATLSTIAGLDLAHLPESGGEPEVDFVLTVGTKRIPLEVKYQRRVDPLRDTEGLRTFIEKSVNNAPFGILVTQVEAPEVIDPRIVALPLSSLMLLR